ncbi:MAG: histidine kinase [Methylocystis sp.]|uniref:histidine kinase n=1 Tax=Methylocystis sp. TaxID=1911079 RepID=UPI003DA2C898
MTHLKLKLPFARRGRRRPRRSDDPSAIFKTFIHLLSRMQAHAKNGASEAPASEKA